MSGTLGSRKEGVGKSRLESLSDAIFAFAMTLLVISLTVPIVPEEAAQELLPGLIAGMSSEFLIFAIAFFILAGYWLSHHRILHSIDYIDMRLTWLNIFLLFFVVLIPFSTAISGDYDKVLEAVLIFHINLLCASVLLTLIWLYIRAHYGDLTKDAAPDKGLAGVESAGRFRALATPAATVIAILVTFVNPAMSMLVYLLIPVILVFAGKFSSNTSQTS